MIYSYGVTEIGPYHIKSDTLCQDAHYIKRISDNCIIAAVADGLGSARHSDVASKIASKTTVEFCAERFISEMDDEDVLQLITQSFRIAQCEIEDVARGNGHELVDYDTTLDLVIYCAGKVLFGHAGDSGIVIQTSDGMYGPLTEQQRDDYGRVYPLIFEDHWVFGRAPKTVASVLLCTDGMLENVFFPVLLRDQPVSIYVAMAQFFMDIDRLGMKENGEIAVQERMTAAIAGLREDQVNDDKTVVVLCDSAVEVVPQADEYYAVPDFPALKRAYDEKFNRLAYPHLVADEVGETDLPGLQEDDSQQSNDGEAETSATCDSIESVDVAVSAVEASYTKKLSEISPGTKQLDLAQSKNKHTLGEKLRKKFGRGENP